MIRPLRSSDGLSPSDASGPGRSRRWYPRILLVALTLPTIKSALGIDGGVIFQILAVENLGASPAAIGTALGLGVLSIPVQLWATRMSMRVSRRNLLAYLGVTALLAAVLALLLGVVGAGRGHTILVVGGLGVTVAAEIAVSVLFATSWQPLLSATLDSRHRQSVNSRGRAAGSVVLVLVVLVFGWGDTGVRMAALLGIAAVAGSAILVLRRLPLPLPLSAPVEYAAPGLDARDKAVSPVHSIDVQSAQAISPLLLVVGFAVVAAWPLFPVYAATVFLPSAHLGLIGAVDTGASIGVALLWRSTSGDLLGRASVAATGLLGAALIFVALPKTASTTVEAITLVAFGTAVAARDIVMLAVLELVHRGVSPRTSVRSLTLLDVVESTALQAGLYVGGLLIAWSATTDLSVADPYRLYVLAITACLAVSLFIVRRRQPVGSRPV